MGMTTRFLDFMKEVFSQPDKLEPEKLKELIDQTMGFFDETREKFSSPDSKEREEAVEALLGFKMALEQQMVQLTEKTGYAPEELAFLAETEEFSLEEQKGLADVKGKIAELKAHFPAEEKKKSVRKKRATIKLTG